MNTQRFNELLAAYGAERRRWPEAERELFDAGQASEAGRVALAQAERLDQLLDGWAIDTRDPDRAQRIIAATRPAVPRRATLAWISTAFTACLMLGFALGFASAPVDEDERSFSEQLLGSNAIEDFL